MATITTGYLRNAVAREFMNSLDDPDEFATHNSLYLFIGQQLPWNITETPPIPVDGNIPFKFMWDNMIAAKKITLNNLSMVIKNIIWTSNTNYVSYTDQNNSAFYDGVSQGYIITSNNEVYKCLSNSNNGLSISQPIGFGSASNNYIQTLSDGYQWKYMFNVDPSNAFFNAFWIPVPLLAAPNSAQEIIENIAVPGSLDIITVQDGGNNYANSSQSYIITISGDGQNANAYANVSGGQIQNIVMVNRGQNYTYANVITTNTTGSGANLQAIMPPPGGHGSNANQELGSTSIMVSITTVNDESGFFTISNSFRQNGLLLNPFLLNTETLSSNTYAIPVTTLMVTSGVGLYSINEIVFQGSSINTSSFYGIVIDFDSVSGTLRVNNVTGTPQVSQILYGLNSGTQRYINNIINPDLQKYSGQIIDVDNALPIQRSSISSEQFQFIIKC